MASPIVKRSLWAAAAVILLAAALVLAVPYVASTRIVRERIAIEMSRWSGYRVAIGSPVKIEVWPRLRAVLDDVTFSDWVDDRRGPIATAQRIDLELSALDAIGGHAVFSSAVVVQPTLFIRSESGRLVLPALAGQGRLKSAIDRARAIVQNGGGASLTFPSDAFGIVRVEGGQIRRENNAEPLVANIEGTLDWPTLDSAGSIEASGTWHGQSIRLNVQSASPLTLIAGGTAAMQLSVEGAPATASFDGMAKLTSPPFLEGRVNFATGSFARLAELSGATGRRWSKLQSASLSGNIAGDLRHLKLEGANLEINGFRATGAVAIATRAQTPMVSGSLAFDTVAADDLFDIMLEKPVSTASPSIDDPASPARFDLDLRLSAARATVGAIELTDVAATVQARGNATSFDLLDASALGGTMQGGLRVDRRADAVTAELSVRGADIDGGAFGGAMGMSRLVPVGRGSVALTIRGQGKDAPAALLWGDGKLSADLGPGALSKFDLNAFVDLCRKGGFFSLDQSANGNFAVDGLHLNATITDASRASRRRKRGSASAGSG